MKRAIITLINYACLFYFKCRFAISIRFFIKHKKIVFIDIDNTIADTWPTIGDKKYKNEYDRNLNIPVYQGMKKYIEKHYKNSSYHLVYLTARNYRLIRVTNSWLHKNNFLNSNSSVIVVSRPELKLYFLKQALANHYETTYIDDLSYNHERNEIKYYDSIINEVNSLPITYIGYSKILEINNDLQNN